MPRLRPAAWASRAKPVKDRPKDRPMSKPTSSEAPSLADLRRDIDRIDETMHGLLMERGAIIDRLISVKQTQETG
jgi:hypothetical protein